MVESTPPEGPLAEAMARLRGLMDQAFSQGEKEITSASLATADAHGRVSIRTIFIAHTEDDGLVFFASRNSGKGIQMAENPRVALCFFWPVMQEQVTVEGQADVLDEAESDRYWRSRLRDDQLGAWVSESTRDAVAEAKPRENLREMKHRFREERVPRPDAWRAYRIRPDYIRFWATGWHRVHKPVRYRCDADGQWTVSEESL